VYIEGSIRYDKYTGQDGVEKYSTDIIANEMQMLGGRGGDSGGGHYQERAPRAQPSAPAQRQPAAAPPVQMPADDFSDDDIPF